MSTFRNSYGAMHKVGDSQSWTIIGNIIDYKKLCCYQELPSCADNYVNILIWKFLVAAHFLYPEKVPQDHGYLGSLFYFLSQFPSQLVSTIVMSIEVFSLSSIIIAPLLH